MNEKNSEGDADLTIPLQGPNGSGSLHTIATRAGGVWTINSLDFTANNGNIAILPVPSPCQ